MVITYENNSVNMKIYRADFTKVINLYTKYVSIVRYIYQIYNCKFRVFGDFSEVTDNTMQVSVRTTRKVGLNFKPDNEWHILDFGYDRMSIAPITVVDITTTLSFDYIEIEFSVDNQYIYCFNNTKEDIVVDKNISVSSFVLRFRGTFRDNIDLINPIFDIEWTQIPTFNYVYLNMFGRYYFVDNIECIRNNLYRIYCSIDVLMSYREQLKDLQVYVTRQENNYNEYLPDEKLPVEIDNKVERIYYLPHLFKDFNDIDENMYCFVLTLATSHNFNEYPKKPMTTLLGNITYIMTLAEIRKCINYIISATWKDDVGLLFDDISSSIISLKFYPFDIKENLGSQWDTLTGGTNSIYIGNSQHAIINVGETNLSYIKEPIKFELDFGSINLNLDVYKFLYFEPYFTGKMYLPYYGFCDLPINTILKDNINNGISLKYLVDLITGDCVVNIGDCMLIEFNIGVDISISSTNLNEVAKNKLMLGLKVGGAIITKGASILSDYKSLDLKYDKRYKTPHLTKKSQKNLEDFKKSTLTDIGVKLPNNIATITNEFISANQTSVAGGTSQSMWCNLFLENTPYLLCKIPKIIEPSGYAHILGRPSNYSGRLGDLIGYTEVGAFHLEGINGITTDEKDLLENILRSGIIM